MTNGTHTPMPLLSQSTPTTFDGVVALRCQHHTCVVHITELSTSHMCSPYNGVPQLSQTRSQYFNYHLPYVT